MAEIEIFGVYLNSELVTSLSALILTFLVHRVLVFLKLHRYIWHRPLFETALFIVLWAVVLTFSLHSSP